MKSKQQMSERIGYIDVAKGILILCLLYGHMIIELRLHGINNATLDAMWRFVPFYNAFFMQSFFLITGFCSTFTVGFKTFLWKNIKTLILPAIIITAIGYLGTDINNSSFHPIEHAESMLKWLISPAGPWFVIALFWSKIAYWFIKRIGLKYRIICVVLLYFLGLSLNQFDCFVNVQWHRHSLMMMPYLFIGDLLKNHIDTISKYIGKIALAAIIILPIEASLHNRGILSLPMHDRNIYVYFSNFALHFINVILGTSALFALSMKLQNCKVLKTFGACSLLIYLINEPQQRFVLKFMLPFYHSDLGELYCAIFDIAAIVLCYALFYIVVKLVYGNKYLSYIVGKW